MHMEELHYSLGKESDRRYFPSFREWQNICFHGEQSWVGCSDKQLEGAPELNRHGADEPGVEGFIVRGLIP